MLDLKCKFCNRESMNHNSHRNHERLCTKNPNRKITRPMLGKAPWNKGLNKSNPIVKLNADRVSLAMKGKTGRRHSDETKMKMSKSKTRLYVERPELHPNRIAANNRSRMTYPERVAYDFLINSGINFEHQKKILKYYVDFCVDFIVIEIDGERWHGTPEQKYRDEMRDAALTVAGYVVFRIPSKSNIESSISDILRVRSSIGRALV